MKEELNREKRGRREGGKDGEKNGFLEHLGNTLRFPPPKYLLALSCAFVESKEGWGASVGPITSPPSTSLKRAIIIIKGGDASATAPYLARGGRCFVLPDSRRDPPPVNSRASPS